MFNTVWGAGGQCEWNRFIPFTFQWNITMGDVLKELSMKLVPESITCLLHSPSSCLLLPEIKSSLRLKMCHLSVSQLLNSLALQSVQLLSRVWLFATPWIAARQASLSITNSQNSLRLTSIESVMPSSRLILCFPLLLLPPVPPSIRVFSNESTLRMRWPKYRSFSFSIIPSKEIPGLISFRMDWLDLLAVQGTLSV